MRVFFKQKTVIVFLLFFSACFLSVSLSDFTSIASFVVGIFSPFMAVNLCSAFLGKHTNTKPPPHVHLLLFPHYLQHSSLFPHLPDRGDHASIKQRHQNINCTLFGLTLTEAKEIIDNCSTRRNDNYFSIV